MIQRNGHEITMNLATKFIEESLGRDQKAGMRAEFAYIGLAIIWLEIMDEEAGEPRYVHTDAGPMALQPVGEDHDGTIRPLDDLSYKPGEGWNRERKRPWWKWWYSAADGKRQNPED